MAITRVSGQNIAGNAFATTLTITLTNNPATGNLVVVLFTVGGTGNTAFAVKDGAGTPNNYTLTTNSPFTGNGSQVGIAYFVATATANKAITISYTGSAATTTAAAQEYTGTSATPFESDITGSAASTSGPVNTPSFTPANANDLVVCSVKSGGGGCTVNSPWTIVATSQGFNDGAQDIIQTTATNTTPGDTIGAFVGWAAITAAFKVAAAGGPVGNMMM